LLEHVVAREAALRPAGDVTLASRRLALAAVLLDRGTVEALRTDLDSALRTAQAAGLR
jgi:hypothetical protein